MTPDRRAVLRAACEAATPGPWHVSETELEAAVVYVDDDKVPDAATVLFEGDWGTLADAGFIALARTALPDALDYIDRLERGLRDVHDDLSAVRGAGAAIERIYALLGAKPPPVTCAICGEAGDVRVCRLMCEEPVCLPCIHAWRDGADTPEKVLAARGLPAREVPQ